VRNEYLTHFRLEGWQYTAICDIHRAENELSKFLFSASVIRFEPDLCERPNLIAIYIFEELARVSRVNNLLFQA